MKSDDLDARPGLFATTRWTLVLRARGADPEARDALGELCAAYWKPVYEFVRHGGLDEDAARETAQEFFAHILARGGFGAADPARGRFRSYLLGAVRHFLSDRRDRRRAAKRGGGREHLPLGDGGTAETQAPSAPGMAAPPLAVPPPDDRVFDREWALTVVNRAVDRLAAEQGAEDRRATFTIVKPLLLGSVPGFSQAQAAAALGWTENALRVAVHRLRRRFRELVRAEIAQTVADPAEVGAEIRYLLEVLSA